MAPSEFISHRLGKPVLSEKNAILSPPGETQGHQLLPSSVRFFLLPPSGSIAPIWYKKRLSSRIYMIFVTGCPETGVFCAAPGISCAHITEKDADAINVIKRMNLIICRPGPIFFLNFSIFIYFIWFFMLSQHHFEIEAKPSFNEHGVAV